MMSRSLTSEVTRTLDEGGLTESRIDSHITMAERLLRGLILVSGTSNAPTSIDTMIRCIQAVISALMIISSSLSGSVCRGSVGYCPQLVLRWQGSRGRPRIDVTADMLLYFFEKGFSAATIAMLLHISLRTVRRRMDEYGIRMRDMYSQLTDDDLDRVVTTISYNYPNCGYRMMQGHLLRLGHRVQQQRVRDAMLRMDPKGVLSRWRQTVRRREYSVPTSNSLWHIDGNHRLIR